MTAVPAIPAIPAAAAVRVAVWSAVPDRALELCRLLTAPGGPILLAPYSVGAVADPDELKGAALVVVDDTDARPQALALCGRLGARRSGGGSRRVGLLVVTASAAPGDRLQILQAGADAYLLRPFAAAELTALAARLLHERSLHDRLAEKSAEVLHVNRRLRQTFEQIDGELELARRLQQSLRPDPLPRLPGVRLAAHHQPSGRVGGDFHDAFPVGRDHLGFTVADAMGHGLAACLLGLYARQRVRGLQPRDSALPEGSVPDGSVPDGPPCPGQVLHRLNRDLLAEALPEQPFLSLCYGLYNHRRRTLTFARAGHPHPLYVPRDERLGEPCFWPAEGSLLGVFETTYSSFSHTLNPGDKVLLATDGLDVLSIAGHDPGRAGLLAWAARHRELPLEPFLARLVHDLGGPSGVGKGLAGLADDVTVLALEVTDEA